MNKKPIETARDADLRLSQNAMQRAANRARELAAQTGTAIVISKNGVIEQIKPISAAQTIQEPDSPYIVKPE